METLSNSFTGTRVIPCLSLLVILASQIHTQAQEVKLKKPYTVVVHFIRGKNTKGILYRVNESSIELRTYPKSKKTAIDSQIFEVSRIESIVIRKKDANIKGTLIGTALGALVGIVVEKILFPPGSAFSEQNVGIFVGAGAVLGSSIGAVATKGKKYVINGEQARYDQIGEKLKQFQVGPE